MEIWERLHAVRKDQKLNQEDFGKRIGVTRSAVCNYENQTRPIGDQVIRAVCREFGVSETWLRHGVGQQYEPQADGVIDQLISEYNCTKFEGDFLRAYFQMSEVERMSFVQCVYRLMAPVMKGLDGLNPFADYSDVTGTVSGLDEISDEALHAELDRQIDIEKEAMEKSEAL